MAQREQTGGHVHLTDAGYGTGYLRNRELRRGHDILEVDAIIFIIRVSGQIPAGLRERLRGQYFGLFLINWDKSVRNGYSLLRFLKLSVDIGPQHASSLT